MYFNERQISEGKRSPIKAEFDAKNKLGKGTLITWNPSRNAMLPVHVCYFLYTVISRVMTGLSTKCVVATINM